MTDCPQSLAANTKDQKLNPTTTVDTQCHAVNENHNGSNLKTEWDTTVKPPVTDVLCKKKYFTTVQG